MRPAKYSAVLFDLDGTLLDTAPDLGNTASAVMKKHGLSGGISDERARELASDGMRALLMEASGNTLSEDDIARMKPDFLAYYEEHIADRTGIFPGIPALLRGLAANGIAAGVITNKPHYLALNILKKFPETAAIGTVIGSRPDIRSKPCPDALLLAMKELSGAPENTLYAGDHIRDMEAARNAGMTAVLACWGYIPQDMPRESFGADFLAETPEDLLEFALSGKA